MDRIRSSITIRKETYKLKSNKGKLELTLLLNTAKQWYTAYNYVPSHNYDII